jgi:hypothetical protein
MTRFYRALLLAPLVAIGLCQAAAAQAPGPGKYEELPVNQALKKNTPAVSRILIAGTFAGNDKGLFDQYFEQFVLPPWTHEDELTRLPKMRLDLGNQLKKASAAQVHDDLANLVLEFMSKLAAGPYNPATQVNAMLMIGELNNQGLPITPWPKALDALSAAVENPKLSDAVRAAAMIGIQRHVSAKISDAAARQQLVAALLRVAAANVATGSAAAHGQEWILAQALETLGALGDNTAFMSMVKTVDNSKLSLATRSVAAEALGHLNYSGAAIDPVNAAAALGRFAIDACAQEVQDAKITGKPVSRRRMRQYLGSVLQALVGGAEGGGKGINSAAKDPAQQAFLTELQQTIQPLADVLDDPAQANNNLATPVDDLRTKLEAWLKKQPK